MVLSAAEVDTVRTHERHHRNSRLVALSVLTLVGVTGHFISYTFIVVIIRDVVGVHGPQLAWLLAGFGVAGLLSMAVMARPLDRRPKASVVGCLAALAVAFAVLTALAGGRHLEATTILVGAAAIMLWGAASTALPPMLQAAAMRTAPDDPDGASGRLRHGVPGRNHGRFAVRRAALRAGRTGGDDRGVDGVGGGRAGRRRGHPPPVRRSFR